MTDRYLLEVGNGTLELNIRDNYQAGELRSTKNLSGGESFLVSLALALGLSQMASRTTRVDSLFLDEGFGTLDEDAAARETHRHHFPCTGIEGAGPHSDRSPSHRGWQKPHPWSRVPEQNRS